MIHLALIGCGGMSRTHRARFAALAHRLQVTATVDIELERAQKAASALGAPIATRHVQEALPHCDAVLIALPHHLHHPVGMECLAAGKHVLMEKPLANTERQCLDLIEEAERQGVVLMVAYCMRFHPLTLRMKELIDAKTYGKTFHVSIWTEQYTHYGEGSWAHRAETLGGGQFFSHGCHYVDILLHYLGNPVEGAHMGTNFGTPWMEREGTSDAFIKFESGAVGYHGGTWGAKGTRLGYAFHAQATEGMLEADFYKGRLTLIRGGKEEELLQVEDSSKYTDRETAHFLDCIERRERPITDGPRSLQGLRVIWRMYEAERNKTVADLRGLGLEQPWRVTEKRGK
ncbi:MAG TPA: Gfo/Idh/MocA family oxidoreductase [Chthonomonadaceae bacterium]|nr:Gfo/Idh/MocA family oxidoreductase [Chthonomonadaceae bacterium]